MKAASSNDAEQAQAMSESDKDIIFDKICNQTGGFNSTLRGAVTSWLLSQDAKSLGAATSSRSGKCTTADEASHALAGAAGVVIQDRSVVYKHCVVHDGAWLE